ncbi:MAG: hypothetical protein LBB72_09060 [Spirochaetaceae bacterium]|jgi:hypothetical protein|nr:hypothetical protein [Spirochaetaceae bacterium]
MVNFDSKSSVSRVVELGGREATALENSNLRVMIDDIGGMTPECSGNRSGQWFNAHWIPWFRSNGGKPYNDAEHGSFWKSNLFYHLAGSFPCIPNFGPGHIVDDVPVPPHGWTANQKWRYVTNDTDEDSGAVWFLSVMESPNKGLPLSFSKLDVLLPFQSIHYTSIRVRNRGYTDTEICAAWHNVLGSPFLNQGCRITAAAQKWMTPPPGGEFDTTTRLALGAEFYSLAKAPLLKGGNTDLSVVSAPTGFTDFVTGAVPRTAPLTWLAAVNPALKMAYISFSPGPGEAAEDDIVLYFNNLWMQYGGRPFTPWAPYEGGPDLSYCLGLENSVSAYAYGLGFAREVRQVLGSPATVTIPAMGQKTLRSGTLFTSYEGTSMDEGVASVRVDNACLACFGTDVNAFRADPRFEVLRRLESHHV